MKPNAKLSTIAALSLVPLLVAPPASAETKTYEVGNFSDTFTATVTVEDSGDVYQKGSVSVFARQSGKRVLHVDSEGLAFDLEDGKIPPNVRELPYGQHSVLIYDDFDFDGRNDLAIMDGRNGCYGGPSFQVFLRKGGGFSKSQAFSDLTLGNCGMFQVDRTEKRILTMSKSGCCWHQFDVYDVVRRAPRLIESVVESFEGCYLKRETRGRKGSTEYFLPPRDPEDKGAPCNTPLLGFDLAGPGGKRVEIFVASGSLDYALLVGSERRVEFSFSLHVTRHRPDARFVWNPTTRELAFRNGNYRYVVEDSPGRLGVSVHSPGQVKFRPGVEKSRTGDLRDLKIADLLNAKVAEPPAAP